MVSYLIFFKIKINLFILKTIKINEILNSYLQKLMELINSLKHVELNLKIFCGNILATL